ncbi:MAG: hypothetical protein ACI8T1_004431 [Verrucomicrobiales bacterium]|jgi:hypothetical protein
MKLNALRKVGALAAVSAVSLGYAVAGPNSAPPADPGFAPPADPGFLPPPGGGGGIWDSVGATLSTGYDTDYIWRGYDLGHDYLWTALDLSVPLGDTLELSVGAWYTDGFNNSANEIDIYGSLAFDFGAWGMEVGYTHYMYPNFGNGDETNEAYVSAGTTLGPVDVALAYYYDFDLEDVYVEATAGTSFPLSSYVSLDPSVGVSWIDIDGGDSGLNHAFAKLEFPIALTGSATLTPYVATSVALDVAEDGRGNVTGSDENDYFWGGIALSVDF